MYANLARNIMQSLSEFTADEYTLLAKREKVERVLVVLVSSNRGLCGSYNSNVFKTTQAILKDNALISDVGDGPAASLPEIDIVGVGKKSASFAKKYGYELKAVFDDYSQQPQFEDIIPLAKMIVDGYESGTYDRVVVSYTHFMSTLKQSVEVRQLLPISGNDLAAFAQASEEYSKEEGFPIQSYLFEPSMDTIVEYVLPKLVEIQLYQAVLEAAASEHSSRMVAMKSASDNANDMKKDLTLIYNKARQAAITQEIAEIVGGAAALE
jgi:F-type H+-transporting ATPase subunit gamma